MSWSFSYVKPVGVETGATWKVEGGRLLLDWESAANEFRACERGAAPDSPPLADPEAWDEMTYDQQNAANRAFWALIEGKLFDCGEVTSVAFHVNKAKDLLLVRFKTDANPQEAYALDPEGGSFDNQAAADANLQEFRRLFKAVPEGLRKVVVK